MSFLSSLGDLRAGGKLDEENGPLDDEEEEEEKGLTGDDLVRLTITETKKEDRWDCESILSTYSNLYNHPTTIKEPPKVGLALLWGCSLKQNLEAAARPIPTSEK